VANGGASDDGFEYFRCWLISRGPGVFDKLMADPDSLADILASGVKEVLEFEDFGYVAAEVWGEKTARPGNEMSRSPTMIYPSKPSGTEFKEDAADLSKRYPKLWRRFDKPRWSERHRGGGARQRFGPPAPCFSSSGIGSGPGVYNFPRGRDRP
jgi:hypothetical protein